MKIGEASESVNLGEGTSGWTGYYATNQNNIANVTISKEVSAGATDGVNFTVTISDGWTSGTSVTIGCNNT